MSHLILKVTFLNADIETGDRRSDRPVRAEVFRSSGCDRGYRAPPVAVYNGVNPVGQEVTVGRLRHEYPKAASEIAVRDREEQPFVPILERFLSSKSE